MGDVILKVENVSKLYRLGTVGTGTFGGDVQRFWKTKILGQEDPFLKVGQTNDRTSKEKTEFVWALQDINFEVKRGEVLGIIGKNGAGKSTLLKLLSRITSPTTGTIKSAGRMASLLEVGTGFHPELTGRENIFLNGAILGMTKKEIQSKFDEIVDFSGCELYIDTPTKRYSSGMTVRLGFAVAAFLDPEILVVDEVLAVGDAEFQKKAIGKMKEVSSSEGRTVIFVSHNMTSIKSLCKTAIIMENGQINGVGNANDMVSRYLGLGLNSSRYKKFNNQSESVYLTEVGVRNVGNGFDDELNNDLDIEIIISYSNLKDNESWINLKIKDQEGVVIFTQGTREYQKSENLRRGTFIMVIPAGFLLDNTYSVDIFLHGNENGQNKRYVLENDILIFTVPPQSIRLGGWMGRISGFINPNFKWH